MKIEQIKAKIEALTLNPDNVLEYQENRTGGFYWNKCMELHSELYTLFDEVLGGGNDWGGAYSSFLESLSLAFQTDEGWWNQTAVDKDNIFIFISYYLDDTFIEESDLAVLEFIRDVNKATPRKYKKFSESHINIYTMINEYNKEIK